MSEKEDFQVTIASKPDEDTIVLTSTEMAKKWFEQAMYNFNNNYHQYSVYLNESGLGSTIITNEMIDILADNAQSNLSNIMQINNIVRYYINKDDLIGKVYEAIETNINTEYKLSYKDYTKNRNKQKELERTKGIIEDFNKQINLKSLIRKSIPMTYIEGTYPMYLRKKKDTGYIVDYYPLKVIEVSDYEFDGEPYLLCNINELTSRLNKVYKKNRKGSPLFFDTVEQDVLNNYPKEIYDAYKSKNQYSKLDIKYSGVLRVNNLNRKYGLTPIFKALKSAIMLETFEKTDRINSKAKGKKIIFQQLRKETMGKDFDKQGLEEMSYAHDSFMGAWKNETVVYTGAPFVEDLKYIEPKTENINIDSVNHYRSKMMTALGIGFLNQDSKQTFTVANISVDQLMRTINKISEQLEDLLEKWYKIVLQDNGINLEYCPTIKIIDAEVMSMDIKMQLVELLYSKLNCSFETAYSIAGIDIKDEYQKRKSENEDKYDEVFTARQSMYTSSGNDNKTGRPTGNAKNPDMTDTFKDINDAKK